MSRSFSLAETKLPFIAVFSASLISVGSATLASEYSTSFVIFGETAFALCNRFATLRRSPSAMWARASFASSSIVIFSSFDIWFIADMTSSFVSGLNLNTAHLLCIGSMILLE